MTDGNTIPAQSLEMLCESLSSNLLPDFWGGGWEPGSSTGVKAGCPHPPRGVGSSSKTCKRAEEKNAVNQQETSILGRDENAG